jgi:hypothetical protein
MEAAKSITRAPCKIGFYAKFLFNYPVLSLACSHHFVKRVEWGKKYAESFKLAYSFVSNDEKAAVEMLKTIEAKRELFKRIAGSFNEYFSLFILMNSEIFPFDLIVNCLSTMRYYVHIMSDI